ncbi:ankyrin repeat-containing domain protein [Tuber borchii]|uniref:Ankyrin repeat-containing domain protein n=1 Tax=Tuber borchii TaxID=42251 RepID=A0A2T7A272_TUBBO|nr:ankyrin repeat-containing domain protein [Tuber borchii]
MLLERGDVNSDSSDKFGWTPLSYAAGYGHEGIVKMLLERRDVNSDSSDRFGLTPLSYAARDGYEGIVKILLERGDVNSDSSGKNGRTPLSYAAGYGHEGILKMLLERGDVNSDSSDNNGLTPFMHAERSGKIGVLPLLSAPRPFSHRTSQTSDPELKVASPPPPAQEEAETRSITQQEGIIPDLRPKIAEATPPPIPDQSPLNQRQAHLPVSAPAHISSGVPSAQEQVDPGPVSQQQGTLPQILLEMLLTMLEFLLFSFVS